MFVSRLGHQLLPTQWRPEQRASTLRQTFQEVEMRRQTSCPPTTYSIAQVLLTCKLSVIISSSADTGWPNVFKLVFDKNPLSSPTDFKLEVKMLPLQLSYHEEVFSDLLDFLFLPQMDCLEVTWGFIFQGYKYGLQFSKFIQNCLTSRVLCDLNIDLQNPCIQVGQYGKTTANGSNLIIDCGRLKVESAMVTNDSSQVNSPEEIHEKMFDRFLYTFSGMQIVHLPSAVQWASVCEEPSSEYHLIPKTKMNLTLSTSIFQVQDFPAWKLDAFIKCAKLNLSDSKLSAIIDFLRDLPLPSRSKNMQKYSGKITW